jgi:DNA-binding CsgD family transcriptional regulator
MPTKPETRLQSESVPLPPAIAALHHTCARSVDLAQAAKTLAERCAEARQANRVRLQELRDTVGRLREHRRAVGPPGSGAMALSGSVTPAGEYRLTPREVEVAGLLAEGCSNSELASRLGISPHTARHHTESVLAKLGVSSRAQAGALLRGWLPLRSRTA